MKEADNQVDTMSLVLDIFLSSRLHVSVPSAESDIIVLMWQQSGGGA